MFPNEISDDDERISNQHSDGLLGQKAIVMFNVIPVLIYLFYSLPVHRDLKALKSFFDLSDVYGFCATALPLETNRWIKDRQNLLLDKDLIRSGRAQLSEFVFKEEQYARKKVPSARQ